MTAKVRQSRTKGKEGHNPHLQADILLLLLGTIPTSLSRAAVVLMPTLDPGSLRASMAMTGCPVICAILSAIKHFTQRIGDQWASSLISQGRRTKAKKPMTIVQKL